jgi:diamine N-acetyltransferase
VGALAPPWIAAVMGSSVCAARSDEGTHALRGADEGPYIAGCIGLSSGSHQGRLMITLENGLVLRKIDELDIESNWEVLLALRNDVDTALQILSRPFGQTRDDIRSWIKTRNAQSGCVFLGIFLGGAIRGYVMFVEECRISGTGEISITLGREARGKGIGTAALAGFVDFLFAALDYRKFVARILDSNMGSIRVFETNGFELVGILRRHRKIRGTYRDVRIYERIIEPSAH